MTTEPGIILVTGSNGTNVASGIHLAAYYAFFGAPGSQYDEITVPGTGAPARPAGLSHRRSPRGGRLTGVVMWFMAILAWPAGTVWFGMTREVMLLCAILSLLTAIWFAIGAMHHTTLEKAGEVV